AKQIRYLGSHIAALSQLPGCCAHDRYTADTGAATIRMPTWAFSRWRSGTRGTTPCNTMARMGRNTYQDNSTPMDHACSRPWVSSKNWSVLSRVTSRIHSPKLFGTAWG